LNVVDANHPNLGTPLTYISRYWELVPSGITTPDYDVTYTYKTSDVVGTEADLIACKYSTTTAPNWNYSYSYGVGSINTTTHTLSWTGVTSFSGMTGMSDPGALPIQLTSFKAKLVNNRVEIFWTTASETNSDYFTIEKTKDFTHFETVARVEGAGNSISTLNYSTVDTDPYHGISYYRLKQTDYNGMFTYSKNVSINLESEKKFKFDIYPNPSDGISINLFITAQKDDEVMFVLSDASGKEGYSMTLTMSENGINANTFHPAQKLSPGTYSITGTCNQRVFTKRLVVK